MNHTAASGAGNSGPNFFRQFFDIQERIGFGSFGDVYRVKSKVDNKEYAIKKSRRTYTGESDRLVQYKYWFWMLVNVYNCEELTINIMFSLTFVKTDPGS